MQELTKLSAEKIIAKDVMPAKDFFELKFSTKSSRTGKIYHAIVDNYLGFDE